MCNRVDGTRMHESGIQNESRKWANMTWMICLDAEVCWSSGMLKHHLWRRSANKECTHHCGNVFTATTRQDDEVRAIFPVFKALECFAVSLEDPLERKCMQNNESVVIECMISEQRDIRSQIVRAKSCRPRTMSDIELNETRIICYSSKSHELHSDFRTGATRK